MCQFYIGNEEELPPAKLFDAEYIKHPRFAAMEEFDKTGPERILVSVAYCMKDSTCAHRDINECDIGCTRCEISRLKQVCADKAITFRIETSNENLMEFLNKEVGRFDWFVGIACSVEMPRLYALLWEKHRLRQLTLPMVCASHSVETHPRLEVDARGLTRIGAILELLKEKKKTVQPAAESRQIEKDIPLHFCWHR